MSSAPTIPARGLRSQADDYVVTIAATGEDVVAAQRLRYQVFRDELGALLHSPEPGSDTDAFDEHCDHLVVRHRPTGSVVGTYRLLPPGRTDRLYSDGEFDTGALRELRGRLVEAGRSCVHPEHRGGTVINLMWSALADYVLRGEHRYLAGCASVPLHDGGRSATHTWQLGWAKHRAPQHSRVRPHRPWAASADAAAKPSYAVVPPLLRGYLRLGAWVCGPPAHDPDFGVADFFVLLDLERVDERYLRHFLGAAR